MTFPFHSMQLTQDYHTLCNFHYSSQTLKQDSVFSSWATERTVVLILALVFLTHSCEGHSDF
jgi:hypothetical protein